MLVGSTWPSALVAWAVYRYQLFDVIPLAREAIFEDREEAVFVLDADGRVLDYNRAAVEAFPPVEGHTGTPLAELVPELVPGDGDAMGFEDGSSFADSITRITGDGPHEYAVGVSTLSMDGEVRGYSLVLRDAWETTDTREATLVVETDADVVVYADERRLQNVFENLVRNAVEHGGPDVTVRLGRHADGFYVEDDGPGVPPDQRADVFEFDYTTREEGTGLGLAIVDAIAQAHGWTVDVAEGSEGGARVVFSDVDVIEVAGDQKLPAA